MSVTFTIDTQKFKKDLERVDKRMRFAGRGTKHILAVQMAKDTEPYVPALTKSMANRVHPDHPRLTDSVQVNDDTIIYPGPYARFLYYGKLMIDPKTGSSWATKGATKVVTGKDLNISQTVHGKAQSHWFEASKAQNLEKWKRVAGRAMRFEFGR